MIENAETLPNTLMLNTTQIVIRTLTGTYSDSYAELVPVAEPIGSFTSFPVHRDGIIQSTADLVAAFRSDTVGFVIGGGSAPGGIVYQLNRDALAALLAPQTADPRSILEELDARWPIASQARLQSKK